MFTFASMMDAYKKYGNELVIITEDGTFSANPSDCFCASPSQKFRGDLAVRVPERYNILHEYNQRRIDG